MTKICRVVAWSPETGERAKHEKREIRAYAKFSSTLNQNL